MVTGGYTRRTPGRLNRGLGPRREHAMDVVLDQHLRARILTTSQDTDGRHDLVDASMSAGSSTPLHLHTRYEERQWVLEGSRAVGRC